MFNKNARFTQKSDGFKAAKRVHVCRDCLHNQPETYKECPKCHSRNRVYFPSRTEHIRAAALIQLEKAGDIERLRFHVRFDLVVNGVKLCQYVCDADYYAGGVYVVEDTKSESFMDELSKLKIRLFQALYGITVTIPQRKSGGVK